MKKVLVSPGFGAGWATWNTECGKALAEDEQLIALVEAGKHKGSVAYDGPIPSHVSDPDYYRNHFMARKCSPEFLARAIEVGRANGCAEDWSPYCGGVDDLEVVEVHGPYRIDEYDGSESIRLAGDEVWW